MQRLFILFILLGVCAIAANDFEDYQAWKAEFAARHAPGSRSTVGNDYVVAHCEDTTGMFTIGTTDGQNLTYGFPSEGSTSHITVKIDDIIYTNDSGLSLATELPAATTTIEDNTIVTTTTSVEGIVLTQYLEPVQSDSAGAIWIYYTAENTDTVPHDVGLLLEIDTQIGNNDGAPLATSFGLIDVETEFTEANMPTYWQAYESDEYDPTYLIGEGVLAGGGAVSPSYFCAGAWGDLYDVLWDYTASGEDYYDSGVIYRWDQGTIAPGGSRLLVGTLYGVGEVSVTQGDLSLLLAAPEELVDMGGYLSPNPFEVNLIVQNTTTVTAENVQATLELQEDLTLYECEATQTVTPANIPSMDVGVCSWRVWAMNPPQDNTYTLAVGVTSDNTASNSVSRQIFVPHVVAVGEEEAPAVTRLLEPNQPNPFNPSTRIAFSLSQPGVADIHIFNAQGRLVRRYTNVAAPDGHGAIVWDGRDDDRREQPSGVYFYQLRQNDEALETRRMVMMK